MSDAPFAWPDRRFARAAAGRSRPIPRTSMDGYTCHLATPVARDGLRRLLATLAPHGGWEATPPNGGALDGRSAARTFELPSVGTVFIKGYRHGGMLRFIRRQYYIHGGHTRPVRELHNLLAARDAGLNVPEPVAGISRGRLIYRGWLVTRFVPGRSLVDAVSAGTSDLAALLDDLTRQVGVLIAHRVAHVDLHPGNVRIAETGAVYLLDFDRAVRFRKPVEELRQQYDVRWRRAVEKHALPAGLADRFSANLSRLTLPDA
jgi:tRNA A-37 threonylcarbamoyl transferase component Bud32